jgi:hypothetical protein
MLYGKPCFALFKNKKIDQPSFIDPSFIKYDCNNSVAFYQVEWKNHILFPLGENGKPILSEQTLRTINSGRFDRFEGVEDIKRF